jgi:hypothetical protein
MPHLIIRVTVQDFGKWKPVYDSHLAVRQSAGLKELNLWRNADKSNEVVLLFYVSDIAKAKEYTLSTELKEKLKTGGVIGPAENLFLLDKW